MKQIPLAIGPEPLPTFDNFVPGANAAALQHLRTLVLPAAPVYLWGPPGSGKTHLLHASAARCRAAGQVVAWFDAVDRLPWTLPPAAALAVIDRCEALDADAQHAAFALFVDSASDGVQLLAAGRLPPVDLPLRDDLRTRLAWGHVFALEPLAEAETRAVLRREADRRGIFLSDEVMDHLLTRFERDLSHLMRLLDRLDQFALAKARAVTVPLLRQMMLEEGPEAAHEPVAPGVPAQ
ncbi:MAG: DnaA regulatory inactivator Hda [Rubrivivax sp.]|nr:DnaA regulatory inactivator Hda [Rubrivivax sp.]